MDVREKLVEILLQEDDLCKRGECKDCFANGSCYYYRVADRLISNGVTVQEWIPVDDRMPTQEDAPTEYVFTAYKNQNCYDVEIALWDTVIAYPDMYDYWMALPLPQPPKGE